MVFSFYRSNQIIRAEKYIMGKKTKEWNLVTEFKKDNTINFMSKIQVIIPAYNEEKLLQMSLMKSKIVNEVIVISNNSTDTQ
jgi:cellulose synthase/poly-beta-1,6-N-acetylglucosamine synthase-like glycosyltransferase